MLGKTKVTTKEKGEKKEAPKEPAARVPGEFNLAWAGRVIRQSYKKLVNIAVSVGELASSLAELIKKDESVGEVAYAFAFAVVKAREAYQGAKRAFPKKADRWELAAFLVFEEVFGKDFMYHENISDLPEDADDALKVGDDGKGPDKLGNIVKHPHDRNTAVMAILEAGDQVSDDEAVVEQLSAAIRYAGERWASERSLAMPRIQIKTRSKKKLGSAKSFGIKITDGIKGKAPGFSYALPLHQEALFDVLGVKGAVATSEALVSKVGEDDKVRLIVSLLPMLSDKGLIVIAQAINELTEAREVNKAKAKVPERAAA